MALDVSLPAPPQIAGHELGRLIARRPISEVWEAVRTVDGRRVAIKVVNADPEAVDCALREASVAGRDLADHLVTVEATVRLPDGRLALFMPLLRGGDVGGLIAARGHLSPGEVVTILAPVASALGRLHAAGVVHGDLSPSNILLDLDGRPFLADAGVGRVIGESAHAVWGTQGYVAPEVLLGEEPRATSDVYGLGAIAWCALSGSAPGPPGLREPLDTVNRAGGSAAQLIALVERCVQPDSTLRPSADEFACALHDAARPAPLTLVDGADDVTSVTYRLRAAAGTAADDGAGAGPHERHRGRHRNAPVGPQAPRKATTLAAAVVLAALITVGLGAAAVAVWPVRDVRQSSSEPSATPSRVAASDLITDRTSPTQRPLDLLSALASARAEAYRRGDASLLRSAVLTNSPLGQRDREALAAMESAGVRYDGLNYVISDVASSSVEGTTAVLEATVATTSYAIRGRDGAPMMPAQPDERVAVSLEYGQDGWRLAALRVL